MDNAAAAHAARCDNPPRRSSLLEGGLTYQPGTQATRFYSYLRYAVPIRLGIATPTLSLREITMAGSGLWVIVRLARAKMAVISALTYLTGAVLGAHGFVDMHSYFAGWLFVILTQFMTHFLGEVADFESDELNRYSSPVTGGSKAIQHNSATKDLANRLGYATFSLSTVTLLFLVPSRAQPVGLVILILAWAYSAEPVKLNHRCLGELDGAIVTNYLLPYFAAAVQGNVSGTFPWWDNRLAILVVPPMIVKISLFLLLNLADRRPDWAAGKITLAVVLGDRASARLHTFLMVSAYMVAVRIAFVQRSPAMLLFVLPSLPFGLRISGTLMREVPYRLHKLLRPALLHSTLLVWGVLLHTLFNAPASGLRFYHIITVVFAYLFVGNLQSGHCRKSSVRPSTESAYSTPRRKTRRLSLEKCTSFPRPGLPSMAWASR